MNPAEWLARAARSGGDSPALFEGEVAKANYREFAARAASIAAGLNAQGVRRGSRVAILMKNCVEYLEVLFGIWWVGAVAVPINAKLHPKEALWIIEHSEAEVAFVSSAFRDDVETGAPACLKRIVTVPSADYAGFAGGGDLCQPCPMNADDMVWLFYTSGTTGRPKGVMITAENIQGMVLGYLEGVDRPAPGSASLYSAPMSHGAGLYGLISVLVGGRHICPVSGGFDEEEVLDLAQSVGPVGMFAAPTMVRRLVDFVRRTGRTAEGLATIVYGGGPMYLADIVDAVEVMGPRFVQIYGQGECPMGITVLRRNEVTDRAHARWKERLRSVGIAQAHSQVRVVGPDGEDVGPGVAGEVVVRGIGVMAGYWRNPDATAKAIRDGWLWTGDIGRLDAEGYLTLEDRSKDVIISGGTNIYPREVEEVLLTHPSVAEVSVVGVLDAEWGEIVVAFVVAERGTEIDFAELDRLCIDNIARFKRPKQYIKLDDLPKNNYGKVLKTELRLFPHCGGS